MPNLESILKGGDLRSIGQSNNVVSRINNQKEFDELFRFLFHADRKIVMRAADAIEKVTFRKPNYLDKHKEATIQLCVIAENKELKWHLAQLLPRFALNHTELKNVWKILTSWIQNVNESKIVRVNALQGMFTLTQKHPQLKKRFFPIVTDIEKENIPSLNARIKRLKLK